ncbi:hypothetical protein [Natrinema limicola]|uniref:Rpa-associated protein n=1 Tax=Natrinema limicola JCM 13563 TaxID=1230457 RepID=M0C6W9_9EURY|nr:hypothetical protein [Natrinema limicola]ELZ17679.1 hypothetical protein C476_14643 [Natrinema limicola JCM 13563]
MSANGNENGDEIPGREIAYRLFAAEYDDASLSYAESDEERAPNYVISPTGARLNRVFVVGTLTEVTSVNDEMVRARVVDPTGAFVVYAGQYQPDELAFLEQATPPAFVAVTGKARTFQPDDSDQVYTSIRPESIAAVDADTRDRWVVSAAERTLERVGTAAGAAELDVEGDALTDTLREAGVESGLAAGIPLAQDHYGTTPSYLAALRDCALEAVEVVAGERDQVTGLELVPDATSPDFDATAASLADLADLELDALEANVEPEPDTPSDDRSVEPVAATAGDTADAGAGAAAGTATSTPSETADLEPETDLETETVDADHETDGDETAEPETESEPTASEPASDEPAESDAAAADTLETEDEDDTTDDRGDFDAGDVDDGMYEMDEEEREQLEAEFGAEFTTGSEVDDPGEADIEVPDPAETEDTLAGESAPEDATEQDSEIGTAPESGLDTAASDEPAPETVEPEPAADTDDAASDDEPAADVDLEDYVVETMEELDDGDGADRTAVIETVVDDTGVPADEVEDAIQDALMGGQCYEPDDETLKAI